MARRRLIKNSLMTFVYGLSLSLLVGWGQGLIGQDSLADKLRILSDACFLPATVLIGLGLLGWMANLGQFTSLKYVGHLLKSTFAWGFPRPKPLTYAEFRDRDLDQEDREFLHLVYAGLGYLALALAFSLAFAKVA